MPPLPPKLIGASISFSKAFKSSTISVTIAGKGDVVPQACHSCNVIESLPGSVMLRSLGGEREAELWRRRGLGLKSMWVLVKNARDDLKVKALVLVVVMSMVELC